jgi:hypothetical protein
MPGTRSALWLGADHILLVRKSFGTEEYRRFYFKDIQAIIVRSTRRMSYLNFIFIGLALLVLAIILLSWNGAASVIAIVFSIGLFGIPILVNLLLGPCCDVQIRTAVQIEDLPALSRLSRAERVLGRVRPLIQAAQGSLTAEEIVERLRAFEQYPAARRPAPTSPLGLTGNESS